MPRTFRKRTTEPPTHHLRHNKVVAGSGRWSVWTINYAAQYCADLLGGWIPQHNLTTHKSTPVFIACCRHRNHHDMCGRKSTPPRTCFESLARRKIYAHIMFGSGRDLWLVDLLHHTPHTLLWLRVWFKSAIDVGEDDDDSLLNDATHTTHFQFQWRVYCRPASRWIPLELCMDAILWMC